MPAPLAFRRTYIWVLVSIRYAGKAISCNTATFTRDAEAQFVQTTDVHGTAVHSYDANMSGVMELEIPWTQKLSVDFLGSFPTSVDVARLAGQNPGTANPTVPFLLVEPASGYKIVSAYGRVDGHPRDISFEQSGEKMRTFRILCPECTIFNKGLEAAV